ncbi:MAG: hypothetical protein JW908_01430 [Anaerolineales bacterium]|nr:hypothetical protein [Anaerolineales bacterium]
MSADKAYNARLSQSPANAITEFYVKPRLAEAKKIFHINLILLKAHAVMLLETGIIKKEFARAILKELLRIDEAGFESITLNPELNDLYLNLNMILIDRLGEDVGGWLHIAMSRNDFDLTETRLQCRELINASVKSLLELMNSLLELSRKHIETVMPG